MTLYRGPGGTGSATSDADTTLYQDFLNQTLAARDAALAAETAAELAETNAETAETNAETAEANAETAATNAASSASAAATSASNASSSASSAATSASSASTSATAAASSASSASSSASAASTSATSASTSATNAATSATNAANSATSASTSESTATTQATNAASSASAAATSASSASTSATSATNSASSAATSATNAANSGAAASTSATSAATSASASAASAAAASAVVLGNEPVRPSVRPSLLLDFANTKQLDPRITFTRASTATFYDGRTVAKAEENLLLQSQEFTTTWPSGAVGATATANTSTAPDGTTTADTLTEDSSTGIHVTSQTVSVTGAVTKSVFAKLGSGTRFLTIGFSNGTANYCSATFDLSLGTSTQTQAGGTYSSASATINAVAQGFYRCTLTVTTDTATLTRIGLNNTGTPTASNRGFGAAYTGNGTSSLILWGAQLEQRSTVTAYTPTTTQPITNYIPALRSAAAGVARFEHNPVTGESLGLEIEESRSNLVTYSEQFNDAAWTKLGGSITANTIVAPDGALTGDKLVEDTSTGQHRVYRNTSGTTNTNPYTYSFFAKAGERTRIYVGIIEGTTFSRQGNAVFDLSNGTIASFTVGTNGASGGSASITSIGNGWYRCSYTLTLGGTDTTVFADLNLVSTGATISYTGNGYSGIYIWGAQLEAAAFATSYIPTVASQVTRSADAASMTGANFSSWFGGAPQGTMYGEAAVNGAIFSASAADRRYLFSLNTDASVSSNVLAGALIATGASGIARYNGDTTSTLANNGGTVSPNVPVKYILSFNGSTIDRARDGGAAVSLSRQMDSGRFNTLGFGIEGSSIRHLNGTLRKLAFYPKALTAAELQALTQI